MLPFGNNQLGAASPARPVSSTSGVAPHTPSDKKINPIKHTPAQTFTPSGRRRLQINHGPSHRAQALFAGPGALRSLVPPSFESLEGDLMGEIGRQAGINESPTSQMERESPSSAEPATSPAIEHIPAGIEFSEAALAQLEQDCVRHATELGNFLTRVEEIKLEPFHLHNQERQFWNRHFISILDRVIAKMPYRTRKLYKQDQTAGYKKPRAFSSYQSKQDALGNAFGYRTLAAIVTSPEVVVSKLLYRTELHLPDGKSIAVAHYVLKLRLSTEHEFLEEALDGSSIAKRTMDRDSIVRFTKRFSRLISEYAQYKNSGATATVEIDGETVPFLDDSAGYTDVL